MSSIRLLVWLFNDKPTVLTLTLSSLDGRVLFKGLFPQSAQPAVQTLFWNGTFDIPGL